MLRLPAKAAEERLPIAGTMPRIAEPLGILAVIGGFRGLVADWLWLRANVAWEHRDAARTTALLRAVMTIDDRSDYFRLNAARVIAYDLPTWKLPADAPKALIERVGTDHAEQALQWLEEGLRRGEPRPALWVEMARIRHDALHDLPGAAACFGRAAELPGAPPYAARLCVKLLVRSGFAAEARAWAGGWLQRNEGRLSRAEAGEWRDWLAQAAGTAAAPHDDAFDMTAPVGR